MADLPTNPDQTAAASADKMAKSVIVGDSSSPEAYNVWAKASGAIPAPTGSFGTDIGNLAGWAGSKIRGVFGIPSGAQPVSKPAATVTIKDTKGNIKNPDLRVKIRVPDEYIRMTTRGSAGELFNLGGIIFPYTPSISYEHKADYASSNPMHSNFAINFYQRSSISNISISGKFTVQNEKDAAVYLATVHLLRALTKMKSGGEVMSGAPPPVCRLDAYGDYMLANVPVAIGSFRIELPDGVDYFTIGQQTNSTYGVATVPIVSTIAITCVPMYSRAEMQKFTVSGWLSDASVRKSGIL
jgi:hypothetical protein